LHEWRAASETEDVLVILSHCIKHILKANVKAFSIAFLLLGPPEGIKTLGTKKPALGGQRTHSIFSEQFQQLKIGYGESRGQDQ
jgi:hypothetical protein